MTIWALLLILLASQGTPQEVPTASISGMVVKLGTNDPIPGSYVELSKYEVLNAPPARGGPPSVFSVTTADDGRFVFRNLPPGRYRLAATRTGEAYTPVEYGQRDPKGRGVAIALGDGERLENVELGMAPTGSINGRIYDGDGEPIGNARVMALEARYRDGNRILSLVQAVRSNDLGEYRLFWLRPGRYYIAVKREDQRGFSFAVHVAAPEAAGIREDASSPVVIERKLEDGQTIEETDVLIYYGGGTEEQKAAAVDLSAGSALSAVDIPIIDGKVRTRRVKGVLVGAPIDQALPTSVRLIPRTATAHTIIPNAIADRQGAFTISGVIPGSYYLAALAGGDRGFSFNEGFWAIGRGAGGLIPLEVGDGDVENVSVVMKPAFTMPGRVHLEGAQTRSTFDVTNIQVSVIRSPDLLGLPQPVTRILAPGQTPSGVASPDGTFTLSGFGRGDYRVAVAGIPETAYVKTIRYGATDVLSIGLKIDNSPDQQLDVLIDLDGATLEGIARNERSEPVTNAVIVMAPDAPLRGMHQLYKTASSDTNGRFELRGIAPGDYKLFAFEFIDSGVWLTPAFFQPIEARGTPVHVGAGGRQQSQVTVLPRAR